MQETEGRLCASCGRAVDAAEQAWLELDNGSIRACALSDFDDPLPLRRVWHSACMGERAGA